MLVASRQVFLTSDLIWNAAMVFQFIGGATLVFSMSEHVAAGRDSTERVILTSMIGGGFVVWSVVSAQRARQQRRAPASPIRFPRLVRVCQGAMWLLLGILLAILMKELISPSPRGQGQDPTSWLHSPILTLVAAIGIGTSVLLRWILETRSCESVRAGRGGG